MACKYGWLPPAQSIVEGALCQGMCSRLDKERFILYFRLMSMTVEDNIRRCLKKFGTTVSDADRRKPIRWQGRPMRREEPAAEASPPTPPEG